MTTNEIDLITDSYDFHLPQALIAQRPIDGDNRDQSRLLVFDVKNDRVIHATFSEIRKFLPENATLVFNQSKVFPARVKAHKNSGGSAELFFLNPNPDNDGSFEVMIKTRSKKNIGDQFLLPKNVRVKIISALDGTFKISPIEGCKIDLEYLEENGLIPIPPYIRDGESDSEDKINYQTVYAKTVGSVAAPTAGLHFTPKLIKELNNSNIKTAFVTLHVGIGTFRPVKADLLKDHQMHTEHFFVDSENHQTIKNGENIFAVGTTTLRVLESMKKFDLKSDVWNETNIFLHPGVEVQSIKGLITNFHLPKSSLLMLVSALIGREKALELYNIAIDEKYRFFSYGDGMLILL